MTKTTDIGSLLATSLTGSHLKNLKVEKIALLLNLKNASKIFLLPLGLVFLLYSYADATGLDDLFGEAVLAVENRDYIEFERILDENPQLLSHSKTNGCPLLCELMLLFRDEVDGDIPGVDLYAIQIAIRKGAPPESYPSLASQLLAIANTTQSGFENSSTNSNSCMRSRKPVFELLHALIQTGAVNMEDDIQTSSGGKFSAAFVYTHQLCAVANFCNADFERPNANLSNTISDALSDSEAKILRNLSENLSLNQICTASFLH